VIDHNITSIDFESDVAAAGITDCANEMALMHFITPQLKSNSPEVITL